jgi:pSer/pThr/pTyr-binding forkhead associated (FHA) protein
VITCAKCTKDNQDHYKFCLGCGAELPRGAAPKAFSPQTPPQGVRAAPVPSPGMAAGLAGTVAVAQAPIVSRGPMAPQAAPAPPPMAPPPAVVAAPPPVAAPAANAVMCPQCGHQNTTANLFCGSCGFRLGSAAPRSAVPAPAPAVDPSAGALVLTALRADGTEAGTFNLPGATGTVGRETGGIFAGDSYLSPRHATFRTAGSGRAIVKDEGSLNGVYKKLGRDVPVELRPNEVFRIGQEIIKFEPLVAQPAPPDGVERLGAPSKGYVGRIALVIGREETGNAFPVPEGGVHLGRERGDILFPEDGYVSGLHCRLTWDGQRLFLTDLGSSNGTFIRIAAEADVRSGDVLLMGQQLFRIAL